MRVCTQPGCGALVDKGRCTTHARATDQARGTRQERGYGAEHERTRAALLPDAYGQICIHCDERMWPYQDLHLDHTEDRTAYRGIVHAACNTRDGAQRGNAYRT